MISKSQDKNKNLKENPKIVRIGEGWNWKWSEKEGWEMRIAATGSKSSKLSLFVSFSFQSIFHFSNFWLDLSIHWLADDQMNWEMARRSKRLSSRNGDKERGTEPETKELMDVDEQKDQNMEVGKIENLFIPKMSKEKSYKFSIR